MNQRESHREIFCKRLKEARTAAGLSQKKLGIAAGIDEFCSKHSYQPIRKRSS